MAHLVPAVCRAARGLLDWTQEELAGHAGVSRSTIREFENGHHALQQASEHAIRDALARAGIEFWTDETAIDVKLRGKPVRR